MKRHEKCSQCEPRSRSGDPAQSSNLLWLHVLKNFILLSKNDQSDLNQNSLVKVPMTLPEDFPPDIVCKLHVRWNKIVHRCQVISARSRGRLFNFSHLVWRQSNGVFHLTLKLKWFYQQYRICCNEGRALSEYFGEETLSQQQPWVYTSTRGVSSK